MNRLYVAMTDQLAIHEHAGNTWSVDRSNPAGERLECIAVSPVDPDRVYCGTFEQGLKRSTDGGKTFERVGDETIEPEAITSLAVDPSDPATILAGTEPSAIYRSTDGGDSWSEIGGLTSVPSADGWSFPPRPHTHHVRWLAIAPDDPDRWYVGIEAGAFLLTPDGGETWIDRPTGSRRDNHWIHTHPEAPSRVYAAAGDGYAESRDRGETWEHPQKGLDHRYVWGLTVDPGDPDVRLVSAASGAHRAHRAQNAESYVYRRAADDPWERVDGLPTGEGVVRPVFAAGGTPGSIAAVSNRGIHLTNDAGKSWSPLDAEWPDQYETQVPRGIVAVG